MIRILFTALACFAMSCGQRDQPADQVYRVGAWDLVAHIRDYGETAYRGQRVQVRVPARSYTPEGASILYYTGLPHARPVIVFHCVDVQPPGCEAVLIVSGTVATVERDGHRKADRVTFTVHVSDCFVTRME